MNAEAAVRTSRGFPRPLVPSDYQPTLYATLLTAATQEGERALEAAVDGAIGGVRQGMVEVLRGVVRDAYISGVRDGFAQGVAAEEKRRMDDEAQP